MVQKDSQHFPGDAANADSLSVYCYLCQKNIKDNDIINYITEY